MSGAEGAYLGNLAGQSLIQASHPSGMASGGTLESIPGSFVLAVDPHVNTDVNDKKRPGNEVVEGDADRRVRPRVDVTSETPEKVTELEAELKEGSQEDLDTRLRALVEVAAQHKGDSPLAKPPGGHFKPPLPAEAAAQPVAGSFDQNAQQAAAAKLGESAESTDPDTASVEETLADSFLKSVPDGTQEAVAQQAPQSLGGGEEEAAEPADAQEQQPVLEEAPPQSPEEDVPISQLKARPEKLHEGEGGEEPMQMDEGGEPEEEHGMEHHGVGHAHGFGAHPQHMHPGYIGYGAHPQYAGHQQYTASAEAQQLAEHAGFGGGHMEQDEDPEQLQSLDLVEVGFPRSSVAELQSLPPDDLITRVLDLEERISAVVREKQLEAAARQEAEDNAARYAEESRQLRQVVREKNGYKKGVLQEIAALEGGPTPLQSAGRFTITREGSPGGGLRLERGNKGKGKHNSPVKEKWKAEWKKAASRSQYVPSASLMGGEAFLDPYGGVDVARHPAGVKGFRSRKVGPAQATPASKLLAILGAEPDAGPQDSDDEEDSDGNDEEYVAPPEPAPRLLGPAGPSPARTSRAESTVGLEDLSEFLRTCCKAQQTGNMTLHRVLWYTYLAWRQKIGSQRPSVSSGGVGLSQCMQRLGHRERLFTREIQAKKAGCKGYEGGGKYWMGLIVLDKALVKTGRQWLAKAKRTGSSNRVTFSRDAAIKVQASKEEPEEDEEDEAEAAEA